MSNNAQLSILHLFLLQGEVYRQSFMKFSIFNQIQPKIGAIDFEMSWGQTNTTPGQKLILVIFIPETL